MLLFYPVAVPPKRSWDRQNKFHLLVLMFAMMCGYSAALAAEQESNQAVTVLVICDDGAKKTIPESLLTHCWPLKDFEVVDKNGYSSLIVYAEKTVNDPKNPNGYAIAIAHTNSIPAAICVCADNIALT